MPQLADELEAALRREAGASLERISLEPAILDGLDAVSLHVRAIGRNEPSSDLLLVAAVAGNRVYLVSYTARSLHFYERDLPAFEQVCRSFRRG